MRRLQIVKRCDYLCTDALERHVTFHEYSNFSVQSGFVEQPANILEFARARLFAAHDRELDSEDVYSELVERYRLQYLELGPLYVQGEVVDVGAAEGEHHGIEGITEIGRAHV